jgi:hypothetical protein
MANGAVTPEGPRFPFSVLGSWIAVFSAGVALVTVWAIPVSLPVQVALTTLFALVPIGILIFWLGGFVEHRRRDKNQTHADPLPQDDKRDTEKM